MGYQGSDNRFRNEGRWQDRGYRGEAGRSRDYRDYDDDRGFIDRAGDEVRSWFGDEEAERRREADQRRYERERGSRDHRDSTRRDRGFDRYEGGYGEGAYGRIGPAETWGGSGFGGDFDRGRRFDRIDPGSVGTHGAHPMSSPVGGAYGGSHGADAGYVSSARSYEAVRAARGRFDPHYSEWRSRQIELLDRDYDDYRREHQAKFDQEFGGWREKRQGQRQLLGRVTEHLEVVGSDGAHVGTVDKVRGDRILLTRSDPSAGGHHHSIPSAWIEQVDDKVVISKSAEEAQRVWRDEEDNRALFERDDQSEGPHILGRSFSGTY